MLVDLSSSRPRLSSVFPRTLTLKLSSEGVGVGVFPYGSQTSIKPVDGCYEVPLPLAGEASHYRVVARGEMRGEAAAIVWDLLVRGERTYAEAAFFTYAPTASFEVIV
jgi:hypothetical protein